MQEEPRPGGDPLSQEEPSGGLSSFSSGAASVGELPTEGTLLRAA